MTVETDAPDTTEQETPRLEPIENPDKLILKIAYWLTRKQLGNTITLVKVIYSRFPESLGLARALVNMEDKFTIDKELQLLIQLYTATVNGCGFCIDMARASLKKQDTRSEKLEHIDP